MQQFLHRFREPLTQIASAGLNLAVALGITGLIIALLGQNPVVALDALTEGSFGSLTAINYTLYYATSFTFAALAFSIPYRAGLFNIGAEGQAYLAGLGVAVWCLYVRPESATLLILGSAVVGAVIAAVFASLPGWLHATNRGNIVITTIMLNYVVYAAMTFLILNFLIKPGQQSPETERFPDAASLTRLSDILNWLGIQTRTGPASIMVFVAIATALAVFWINRHTMLGLRLRIVGDSPRAARYAGIPHVRYMVYAMMLSGVVSSLLTVNELLGVHHRLIQDFVSGYGFVGIAVALMGRGHPIGILPSALLFGALYQGGTELAFQVPGMSRDVVVLVQGIVVFAVGAWQARSSGFIQKLFSRMEQRHA